MRYYSLTMWFMVGLASARAACPVGRTPNTYLEHWLTFENAAAPNYDNATARSFGRFYSDDVASGCNASFTGAIVSNGYFGSAYKAVKSDACSVFYTLRNETNTPSLTVSFFYLPYQTEPLGYQFDLFSKLVGSYIAPVGSLNSEFRIEVYNHTLQNMQDILAISPGDFLWIHVALTLECGSTCDAEDQFSLYVNGVLRAQGRLGARATDINTHRIAIVLGAKTENGAIVVGHSYFPRLFLSTVSFDDFRIYSRVLAMEEIAQLAARNQSAEAETTSCVCPLGTEEKQGGTCEPCPIGTFWGQG